MSLFDSASIVVTPNAYKASKLYAIKPTDGSGDLSVTRATSATRVDANGLIEIPRTNLILRSEEFDTTNWSKANASVSANQIISPDGTQDADLITSSSSAGYIYPSNTNVLSSAGGGSFSYSAYLKAGTATTITLLISSNTGQQYRGDYNLSLGTASTTSTNTTVSIINIGNGWYRCILNASSVVNRSYSELQIGRIANGLNFYAWGAQLEQGVSATEYISTTSSIRTKFAGITQDGSSALNIPRLDYTNGTCPSILVEPQRTNLVLRSEEFDNASWTKVRTTVSVNAITAPDGTLSADKIIGTSGTNSHYVSQTISSLPISTPETISVFVKKAEQNIFAISIYGSAYSNVVSRVFYDINTGTIGTIGSGITAKIEEYSDGWFRCIATRTTTNTGSGIFELNICQTNGSVIYNGNDVNGLYLWGAQLEAGANATSYIPTTTASVTRNADVISKTGISGIATITTTFEDGSTNVISGSPTSYTMPQGRIKQVIGI